MSRGAKLCAYAAIAVAMVCAQVAVAQSSTTKTWRDRYNEATHGVPPYLVTSRYDAKTSALRFTLKNVSNTNIELDHWVLPWGNPNGVDYFAVTSDGRILDQLYSLTDPGTANPVIIRPNQSISGEVSLGGLINFDSTGTHPFVAVHLHTDMVVVWQYQPWGSRTNPVLPVVTGAVVVPRAKPGATIDAGNPP